MKTKTIPFDIETAKKIQAGEIKGRMFVSDDTHNKIRIICFDRKAAFPKIVALEEDKMGVEWIVQCNELGQFMAPIGVGAKESDETISRSIVLEIPDDDVVEEIHTGNICFLKHNEQKEPHPIEESELYQAGYKVGFEAGRCVAFDEKKGCAIKETSKHEFKPFDKVLARDSDDEEWHADFYSHRNGRRYECVSCCTWNQCIPYEGNEHLLGTTDKPKEE